ncbi:hypothetical protein D3C76_946630 [compost metagenome]
MRQIIYPSELMRHRMYISEPSIIEGQTTEEYGIDHLLTRLNIMAILHRTRKVTKDKFYCS